MAFHCPQCKVMLATRRLKHCSTCGAALPAEWLLSEAELEALRQEDRKLEKRRKARQKQRERDAEARRHAGWGGVRGNTVWGVNRFLG
ncbi:MAG: hypothetical protein HS116_27115 [Planctomycetes bacterium]|nr:hypothetical protein [Planctomycetota bacterium]